MFCAAIVELGAPVLGRLLTLRRSNDTLSIYSLSMAISAMVLVFALSRELAPFPALLRRPLPTWPLAFLICWWGAMVLRVTRRGYSRGWLTISLVGLVVGTRLLVLRMWPFDRIDGDMLATIDRALDAGRFPYVNYPPPMPCLPGAFLAYMPAKAAGLGLRYTNIICDALATVAAVYFARARGRHERFHTDASHDRTSLVGHILLSCFMLHPLRIQFSVSSQFPPCLLFSVLLGFAVISGRPMIQALALGIAVGSNQMLVACGSVLFASRADCVVGLRCAIGLALVAAVAFLLLIAPFLVWEPRQFLQTTFHGRNAFNNHVMSG